MLMLLYRLATTLAMPVHTAKRVRFQPLWQIGFELMPRGKPKQTEVPAT